MNQSQKKEIYGTFWLQSYQWALPLEEIGEVVLCRKIYPVPLAPVQVAGLFKLRGKVITALYFGKEKEFDKEGDSLHIVLRNPDPPLSLVVEEMGDEIELDWQRWQPPPPHLPFQVRDLVTKVYPREGSPLLLMDGDKILDKMEVQ